MSSVRLLMLLHCLCELCLLQQCPAPDRAEWAGADCRAAAWPYQEKAERAADPEGQAGEARSSPERAEVASSAEAQI